MQFLCREQRKFLSQVETRLRPEDRQCAGPGPIGFWPAMFEHEAEEIVILPHAKQLLKVASASSRCFLKSHRQDADATIRRLSSVLSPARLCVRSMFANAIASDATGSTID